MLIVLTLKLEAVKYCLNGDQAAFCSTSAIAAAETVSDSEKTHSGK